MAMAELRDWQHDEGRSAGLEQRLHASEERRVQAEGRCFAAERRRLDAERRLAEVESLLDEARAAGERTRGIVAELIALAARLRASIERPGSVAVSASPAEDVAAERTQMADALAVAVERLRARVAEVKAVESESLAAEPAAAEPSAIVHPAVSAAPPIGAANAVVSTRPPHRHSMSAIGRWRAKRKQRKAR